MAQRDTTIGLPIPDFFIEVAASFESSLEPWVDSLLFVMNYPFLWVICYTQAYFFYTDYGGDQIFLICKEKTYDTYQTVWKTPAGQEDDYDYWGEWGYTEEEEEEFVYDPQYDEVDDDNDMSLN